MGKCRAQGRGSNASDASHASQASQAGLSCLPRRLALCLRAAFVPAALLVFAPADAAWRFTPTVDLRETYTDNVALASDDKKEGRFVTEITPGFTLLENTPRLKVRATYQLHYYGFDDNNVEGARHVQSTLSSDLSAILIEDLLYLEGGVNISQQPISAFGPQLNYNSYAGTNSSNVRTVHVSPYLRHAFGATATALLRYTKDSFDSGRGGLSSSDSDSVLFNLNSGSLFRRVGWGLFGTYQRVHTDRIDSNVKTVGANLAYRVSDSLSLLANGGYDEYSYESIGAPVKGKNWSVGFDWRPSQRTSLRATAGKRYFGDSYSLDAMHRSRRSVWNINYSDAVTTTRDQFLLPATIDTASVIDRLFLADLPDPVARRQAVDAYIRAAGLPSSLAESVNYFSNRYILQRRLQVSSAFNTARTTFVLTGFKTRREALSSVEADGSITGPRSGTFNDDTTQTGASALVNLRLTSRSSANVSVTTSLSESNTTSLETRQTNFRAALTRTFSPRLTGSAELRHTRGNQFGGPDGYKENAISASLSLKL